jgi:hypothetical protein
MAHCETEQPDFLSWLRLSIYMCIVSVAIILNFKLRTEPSVIERRMAFPLGAIFWVLSLGTCVRSAGATGKLTEVL